MSINKTMVDSDFFNMESPTVRMVANALSTLTILSCVFLKVPQILHIKAKKSAEGIYVQAMLMEITGFTIVTLYNFTNDYGLMTYLEYPIILLQIYVLMYYVLRYKRILGSQVVPLCVMFYVAFVLSFGCFILPKEWLHYMIPFCTPLSGFAKVTYIYGIIRDGNADAVSRTTWIISLATNIARLFTVFVDSADVKLMINFAVSSALSFLVLFTAVYYQMQPKQPPQAKRRRSSTARVGKESRIPHLHDD